MRIRRVRSEQPIKSAASACVGSWIPFVEAEIDKYLYYGGSEGSRIVFWSVSFLKLDNEKLE